MTFSDDVQAVERLAWYNPMVPLKPPPTLLGIPWLPKRPELGFPKLLPPPTLGLLPLKLAFPLGGGLLASPLFPPLEPNTLELTGGRLVGRLPPVAPNPDGR